MARIGSFIVMMAIAACAGSTPRAVEPVAVYGPIVPDHRPVRHDTTPRVDPGIQRRLDLIDQQLKALHDDLFVR